MISHSCQSAPRLGGKISQVEDGDCFDANDAGLGGVLGWSKTFSRWWFQMFFLCSPLPREIIHFDCIFFFRYIFSDGLKPLHYLDVSLEVSKSMVRIKWVISPTYFSWGIHWGELTH